MDQPQTQPEQSELKETSYPLVCEVCKEKNLTEPVHLITCTSCSQVICTHFASSIDPQNCNVCCKDVVMTEESIVKKSEHYNQDTDKTYTRTSKARQIKFSGLDWLFFSRKINSLSDTELLLAIEYHQSIYHSMMYEREKRRVEYFHRYAGRRFTIPTTGDSSVSSSTVTTVKKTKTIKSQPKTSTETNIRSMLEQLLAKGVKPEDIIKLMGSK